MMDENNSLKLKKKIICSEVKKRCDRYNIQKYNRKIKQEGITIIALVITIIVLLILAGVAISSVEQNKLILQAKKTSDDTKNAKTDELIKTAISSAEIDGLGELKDKELRQNLDSIFKGAGKDYSVSGDETKGWTVGIDGKDYIISPTGANYEKSDGDSKEWEVTGNAVTKYLGTSNDMVSPKLC